MTDQQAASQLEIRDLAATEPDRLMKEATDRKMARLLRSMRVHEFDDRALELERRGLVRRVISFNPEHYSRSKAVPVYVWTPTILALTEVGL